MAALFGSRRHRADLRVVVFDVSILAGVDLRPLPWQERRERLELVAQAFDVPLGLSPVVGCSWRGREPPAARTATLRPRH
jgi:ATP-dependent DNA ligase